MSDTIERDRDAQTQPQPSARRFADLPVRLAVELLIGVGLAGVLLLVAWASSSAIRFVYGGY
jgi:hypothetical protein